MIHYQLQCANSHAFDGWFNDSESFDHQAKMELIACPHCESVKVSRALMAPALGRGTRKARDLPAPQDTVSNPVPAPPSSGGSMPAIAPLPPAAAAEAARLRSLLQQIRSEVEKNCDYVGTGFAEEARRMHYGEREARGIYGETSLSEAEALADEGIEFGVMPWLRRSDS